MGIFDSLKNIAESTIKREASKTIANAVNSIGKGKNRSERFSFTAVPQNLSELQALPEATLDTPFKTVALTMLALCLYKDNPDSVYAAECFQIAERLQKIEDLKQEAEKEKL